jgi:hypothetical protein
MTGSADAQLGQVVLVIISPITILWAAVTIPVKEIKTAIDMKTTLLARSIEGLLPRFFLLQP